MTPRIEPIQRPAQTRQWLAAPVQSRAATGNQVPVPTSGNRVEFFVTIQSYYNALGAAVRRTRENLADFVYMAGWQLDLDTFIDPQGSSPRQTLRDVLTDAASRNVEIRALLDSTANEAANRSVSQDIAKLGGGAIVDPFHQLTGSQHQKFVVVRNADGVVGFCGGSDIVNARLGREGIGSSEDPNTLSPDRLAAPWHDVQAQIRGSATSDLWRSFVQRFREVAANRYPGTEIRGIPVYGKETLREPGAADQSGTAGKLTAQIVRTYANYKKRHLGDQLIQPPFQTGYQFAPDGEMGIFNTLINAIQQTQRFIYLEDQYLVESARLQAYPAIAEFLRTTIEKPTFEKMVIAVAGTGTVQGELYQAASRRSEFMALLGPSAAQKVATYVYAGDPNSPWWFHSKTWIFDDEFALVSSANCNRRSYSCDSEIGVALVDSPSTSGSTNAAHQLRMDLWLKHLNTQPKGKETSATKLTYSDVRDFVTASELWKKSALLVGVDFASDRQPDIPVSENFFTAHPLVKKLLLPSPLGAAIRPYIVSKAFEWDLIDPDGS